MSTEPQMSHRAVLLAMSGLMLGMFVTLLSSTVVSAALPRIVHDLGGSQASYTWVVTATLLALTISTPIWGKLADLFDRKLLVQIGLTIYVIGSILAGLSQSMNWLIGCRVVQGLGVGGLTALVQVILSDLVSPRERGRYAGYLGAVFGSGTVIGPLLGGGITDILSWRWCFYVGVPFGVMALILLQITLHLPVRARSARPRIDWFGALLLAAGASSLLIWISLAGHSFAWLSATSAALAVVGIALLALAIAVERRVTEPLLPLRMFGDRVIVSAVIASVGVGAALFGATVFLSQYMQVARGYSPTASGLLTIPMVAGMVVASTLGGRHISATGRYKRLMISGAALLTLGILLMGFARAETSLLELGVFMLLVGVGVGLLMQNLVLVVQNAVSSHDIGAGSSLIAFFRTLGGAAGVSVMGAILAARSTSAIRSGLTELGVTMPGGGGSGQIPNVRLLPEPIAHVVENAFASGIADVFLAATPLALIALVAVIFMPERPLGTKSGIEEAQNMPRTGSELPSIR